MTTESIEIIKKNYKPALGFALTVAKFFAKKSVQATVVTIVHQNTETFSKTQKVQLYVGAYLLGSMVTDAAWAHTELRMSRTLDDAKKLKKFWDDQTEKESTEPLAE